MNKKESNRRITLFTKSVYYYQKILNLDDYEVYVECDESDHDNRAYCSPDEDSKMAGIFYSKEWIESKNLNDNEIKYVAYHECLELLLSRIDELLTPYYSEKLISQERHRIINIFINYFFNRTN